MRGADYRCRRALQTRVTHKHHSFSFNFLYWLAYGGFLLTAMTAFAYFEFRRLIFFWGSTAIQHYVTHFYCFISYNMPGEWITSLVWRKASVLIHVFV